MIEMISANFSEYVYRQNERRHVSREVLQFAVTSLITNLSIVILSLCIGWIEGKLADTGIVIIATMVLRYLVGGNHFLSPVTCILVSTAGATLVPFIPINGFLIDILVMTSVILIWVYARTDIQTRVSERTLKAMKLAGILLVLSDLLIDSGLLALSWFLVSLALISFHRGETIE